MAITTCTVSGTIKNLLNTAMASVTVYAYATQPFLYSDGTYVTDYKVSTTTDVNGAWSLTLIETASITKTLTIAIVYSDSSSIQARKEYAVIVPATATANFSDLITGQI